MRTVPGHDSCMLDSSRRGHDDAPVARDMMPPGDDPRSPDGGRALLAFEPDDEEEWHRLARGYRLAGLLLSAHRMGLLREMAGGGTHRVDDLAQSLMADRKLLVDVCRALWATGLLVEHDDGWRLSAAGARLANDHAAALELRFSTCGADTPRTGVGGVARSDVSQRTFRPKARLPP